MTVVLDPKTFQALAFSQEAVMNTLFSIAAIGVLIIWGICVASVVLLVVYFAYVGVWRAICAVGRLFTRTGIVPQLR